MPSLESPPPSMPGKEASGGAAIYTVGTLRYGQRELVWLFFWLMWNDFAIMLIESVNGVGQFIMRDQGATLMEIALVNSVGFFLPWLNPLVSTWSDRHRGRWGRRRPFLFWAAPPFALFLAAYPYMPTLHHYLLRYPSFAALEAHLPMNGSIILLGICQFFMNAFNSVVLAVFSYLYWDVVPESHMGRFQALSKNVTLLAGLFSSFFLFNMADHHMKAVYLGTASFCLVVYMVSVWQIKEGEYPPPDTHRIGGRLAPVRAYFVECFSESYYLWIFAASLFFQLGNLGGGYQNFYLHYDLNLDIGVIGSTRGWATIATLVFGAACGFAVGSMTDRLKPVRLMGPGYLLLGLAYIVSFYLVRDLRSYLVSFCLVSILQFVIGVVIGAFTVEVFPREKLGQFCSAQAVFYQFIIAVLQPGIGRLFEVLNNYRLGFLWQGGFYLLAAILYLKVWINWQRRRGQVPVPHAG